MHVCKPYDSVNIYVYIYIYTIDSGYIYTYKPVIKKTKKQAELIVCKFMLPINM